MVSMLVIYYSNENIPITVSNKSGANGFHLGFHFYETGGSAVFSWAFHKEFSLQNT